MSAFIQMLKKYWYIVLIAVAVMTIASFVISIVQKPEYKSSVKLLVIQKQEGKLDAYTAARSAETVAQILSKMIYTSTFYEQVMAAGFEIDKNTFSREPEKRKEEWKRAVDARVVEDSGTIQVDVYDPSRKQAEQLAYAIAYVVINKGRQYHGGEAQIEIKMVDAPITTEKPARPSVLRNTAAGFVLGFLASLGVIFLLSERKSREELTGELEVKTMPKIKEPQKKESQAPTPARELKKEKAEVEEEAPTQVKDRLVAEFEKYKKEPIREIRQEIPRAPQQPQPQKTKPFDSDIKTREVKSRIASGVEKISEKNMQAGPRLDEVVYRPEEAETEEEKKPKVDKYSPEKVEQWIKTGKFE